MIYTKLFSQFIGAVLAIICLFNSSTFGQMDIVWEQTIRPDSCTTCFLGPLESNREGFALGGSICFPRGSYDAYLIQTNSEGEMIGSKTYGGDEYECLLMIINTTDGGLVLVGSTESFGAGEHDFWMIKTDENGDSLWSRTYGGQGMDLCVSVIQTDGGYILAGNTANQRFGNYNTLLVRVNENGDSLCSRTFGEEEYSDISNSIISSTDGSYAYAWTTFYEDSSIFNLAHLDEDLELISQNHYTMEVGMECRKIIQHNDGGYILAGHSSSPLHGVGIVLVRIDEDGDHLWSRKYLLSHDRVKIGSVIQLDDGFLLGTSAREPESEYEDIVLLGINVDGDSLWSQSFGRIDATEICRSIVERNGNYYICATVDAEDPDFNDHVLLLALSPSLYVDGKLYLPSTAILSAYPNPFNSAFSIRFELPMKGSVNLTVYNSFGQPVAELNGVFPAGINLANFDANELTSGTYIIRLKSTQTATQKIMLVR